MSARRYVALLRGVNVGGRNLVSMGDLREAFEAEGFGAVSTYIQSGNVLFESDAPRAALDGVLEAMLERRLGRPIPVVLRSHTQVRNVVRRAPSGFGETPGEHRSDVIFLRPPLSSRQALRVINARDGVDQVWPGSGVVYVQRLSAQLSRSRMGRIVGTPQYQRMTIRNWTTTRKLFDLLDARRLPAG